MHPKTLALAAVLLLSISSAYAQNGRLTLFGSFQSAQFDDGTTRDFNEITALVRLRSDVVEDREGVEYAIDVRGTAYPSSEGRAQRTRLYDAWAGGKLAGGRLALRGGQMWLYELGGLGSVGGVMAEYRSRDTAAGRLRVGLFGGAEPKPFDAGYASHVKKGGAWIALDGRGMRRHVLGYVTTRNSSITERSVLTTMNFVPFGKKLFVYQVAEYDLAQPGSAGRNGLNYIFANARYTPGKYIELMANVHRGRSIDARTISEDILNGRAVDQRILDGFLFESAGGRVTVNVTPRFRVYGGYATDRHNREEQSYGRVTAGLWASNVARSGIDATLSDNRSDRPDGSHDAWYASLGRGIGPKVYLTVDYATSLAVVRIVDNGTLIERHPRSKRYGLNGLWNMTRFVSFMTTLERLEDDTSTDDRAMFGITYRF